jgi:hypothetical protein
MTCGAFAQAPAGAILHVQGGAGVVVDTGVVTTWQDQSGNGYDATNVKGTMAPGTRAFPAGVMPVVDFVKDGYFGFTQEATDALKLTEISCFAVLENNNNNRRNYFSHYSNAINWGYGYNFDLEGDAARNFTSDGTPPPNHSDWVVGGIAPVGLQMVTQTVSLNAQQKSINVQDQTGVLGGGIAEMLAIAYHEGNGMSIGTLGALDNGWFFFEGAIAEIIVYPSVDIFQTIAVEEYLYNKYFIPEPMTLSLLGLGGLALIRRRRG